MSRVIISGCRILYDSILKILDFTVVFTLNQEIQQATASEPLTLEEEHAMQQSWREDSDKLTFIISRPLGKPGQITSVDAGIYDSPDAMIGDVNMFLSR